MGSIHSHSYKVKAVVYEFKILFSPFMRIYVLGGFIKDIICYRKWYAASIWPDPFAHTFMKSKIKRKGFKYR